MPSALKRRHASIIDLTGSSDAEASPPHQPKHARWAAPTPPPSSFDRHAAPTSSSSSGLGHSHSQHRSQPSWTQGEDEGDQNQIIDLTGEGTDAAFENFIPYGRIDGKIVGIRYYTGEATVGEAVLLKREPENQYDPNAIRVDNVQGTQIGHIPRNLAEKLAPYLDDRSILIEGQLAGEKRGFDCPLMLKLYGTSDARGKSALEARMKEDRLPIKGKNDAKAAANKVMNSVEAGRKKMGLQSSQNGRGDQQEQGPSMGDLMQNSEVFRPRSVEELAEQWGSPEDHLAKMAMADQPAMLKAELLPYQRQGLAWMLEKESPKTPLPGSKDVVQLWKRSTIRSDLYTNIATNFSTSTPPTLASGGILADDMGLGKTLQVISVILEGGPGTTLIIAPVSVMSNWTQQIERHVKTKHALRVLTYHGSGRKTVDSKGFEDFDVVITSYGTLSQEYLPKSDQTPKPVPRKTGLFSMNWRRVVLDEAHIIRNHSTKVSLSASQLLATSRWALTGTPIINTIKDFYSMLKFLRITGGLERLELFNAILTRPLAAGDPQADILLQAIMRNICLRRKKEMKFVDLRLPELTEYVHRIAFRADEKEKYDALLAEGQGMLSKVQNRQAGAKGDVAYRHILEILLRLRQVCCHWKLCEDRVSNILSLLENNDIVELNKENRLALQAILQLSIESSDECAVCLDTLHEPVITACKHVFGYACIERVISEQHKCPMCRAPLESFDQLVHPAREESHSDSEIDVSTQSSKTEALMSILKATRRDPKSKVVIFSQWTSFLNIIQKQLDDNGFKYARIDGSMPAKARDEAMAALEDDADTTVLLASLAVCSVGLNLVAADTVILADSWWAPAIEDQAIDRVHRLGQTRPTTVWRLVMEGTVEERVLEIQAEKRLLVGKAFREKGKRDKGGKTTRFADVQKLLR